MLRIGFQDSFWRALKKAEKKDPGLASEVKSAIDAILGAEDIVAAKLRPKKGALKDIFVRNLRGGRRIFLRKESSGSSEMYVAFWVGEHDYYEKLQHSGRRGRRGRRH